jgi:hypothetical protein
LNSVPLASLDSMLLSPVWDPCLPLSGFSLLAQQPGKPVWTESCDCHRTCLVCFPSLGDQCPLLTHLLCKA